MFKPYIGSCPSCPPHNKSIIPTKRGLCRKHLHEFKQKGKAEKKSTTISELKKQGYVRKAIDLAEDWKAKADSLFSVWIRRRYADSSGRVVCFTCPTKKHWGQMTCGHFKKRRHLGTRLYDKNCEVQCYQCQIDTETNKSIEQLFADKLSLKHGHGILEELEEKKNTITKITQSEYKVICEELKFKIDNL